MDFQEVINGNAPKTDYLGNRIADALAGATAMLSAESETAIRIAITEAEAIKWYHDKTEWELAMPALPRTSGSWLEQLNANIESNGHGTC